MLIIRDLTIQGGFKAISDAYNDLFISIRRGTLSSARDSKSGIVVYNIDIRITFY